MSDNQSKKDATRRKLLFGGTAVLLVAGVIFYVMSGRYVSTDDAYVESARVDISSNIPGRVARVFVHDNQSVHRGEPLFELDPREHRIALEDAKAHLAEARLQIAALKASYGQRLAELESARETLAFRQRDFGREKRLAARNIASKAELDRARHALEEAKQKVVSVRQGTMNLIALLGGKPDIDVESHPSVRQAKAALDRAKLDLSYTLVRAPIDGIVTKVEDLQPGDYILAAKPVFALVSGKIWIEANFKETDLARLRTGQMAKIEIDAYPAHSFHGKVESMSPGTGSSFSLLPPENATGNWVKVVQRLPVRISMDDISASPPLHQGLSAVVTVDTGRGRR
jgi:membrane fusion protein (multidrug efflux system)